MTQTPGFLNDHGPDQILGRHSGAQIPVDGLAGAADMFEEREESMAM